MAKRFIDTDIFKKPFVRGLSSKHKLFWIYITANCDHGGIWIVDLEIASIFIGQSIDKDEILEAFNDKIIELDKGRKWLIPSFIEFQYGNLYRSNKAHQSIIKILEKYNLTSLFSIDDSKPEDCYTLRRRLTQSAKNIILARDGHRCFYCSETNLDILGVDHIIPLDLGGNNEDYNLVACCHSCNSKKSTLPVKEFFKKNKITLNDGAYNFLQGAYKKLYAPMDKDMVKETVKDKEEETETVKEAAKKNKKYPTETECIEYFNENGYKTDAAKKFFKYYSTGEWKDAKGNVVKNWKQKAQSVWFKDENLDHSIKVQLIKTKSGYPSKYHDAGAPARSTGRS